MPTITEYSFLASYESYLKYFFLNIVAENISFAAIHFKLYFVKLYDLPIGILPILLGPDTINQGCFHSIAWKVFAWSKKERLQLDKLYARIDWLLFYYYPISLGWQNPGHPVVLRCILARLFFHRHIWRWPFREFWACQLRYCNATASFHNTYTYYMAILRVRYSTNSKKTY